MKCDVLVVMYGMRGRDAEALIPVVYLLKEKYGLNVKVRSVFDTLSLHILKPKVLLINGCTGSRHTYFITKYAQSQGIYVVSQHAEGVFREDDLSSFIWGLNTEKKATVDTYFMWNKNAYDWSLSTYPQLNTVLKISGSVGHEKWLIKNTEDTKILKQKVIKNFQKVITFIGDGIVKEDLLKMTQTEKNKRFLKLYDQNKEYLIYLINKYPQFLFLLKVHPAVFNKNDLIKEIEAESYPNVLVVRKQYSIDKVIKISDLLIGLNSTTQLDAWLGGRLFICLNNISKEMPLNFKKESQYVAKSKAELEFMINQYFSEGELLESISPDIVSQEIIDSIGDIAKKSPSITVAEEVVSYCQKEKKVKTGNVNYKRLIRSFLNWCVYFFPIKIKKLNGFNQLKLYFQPSIFQQQYNEFFPFLEKYFNEYQKERS
tara:strand:- start:28 stop:1314 length:1287 start_codon:yes stop_codon:yes gene_type:complete